MIHILYIILMEYIKFKSHEAFSKIIYHNKYSDSIIINSKDITEHLPQTGCLCCSSFKHQSLIKQISKEIEVYQGNSYKIKWPECNKRYVFYCDNFSYVTMKKNNKVDLVGYMLYDDELSSGRCKDITIPILNFPITKKLRDNIKKVLKSINLKISILFK